MNYYNPLSFGTPLSTNTGLFSNLFKGINLKSIISGTSKTINFVNQTIPTIKNIKPLFNNTKTLFKVMNEFKKEDSKIETKVINNNNSLTFFI